MSYSEKELDTIWKKASSSSEENEKIGFRKDICGAWIKRDKFGEEGEYGWEVDHIYPKSKAEEDGVSEELYNNLKNLQPLHHKNNGQEGKGDDYPTFNSKIVSSGPENIEKTNRITISVEKQDELKELFSPKE